MNKLVIVGNGFDLAHGLPASYRHFNDKKMMRAKVVNKSLCSPLPQNIRFQKRRIEISHIRSK
ncbi:MAG: AbiH family protein [Bacteroidota bacterium]